MKKAFVTGITGFAGSFLAEHLVSKGFEVSGTYLSDTSINNISSIKDSITLYKVDLAKKEDVSSAIAKASPEYLFHLAALAATGESFNNPGEVMINNIMAQLNVLNSLIEHNLITCRTLIVSSAEVYGSVAKENLPTSEDAPLRPMNPYSVSKITQDFMGLQYFLSHGLPVVRVRPFNHIGPRQGPSFVVASFAKKIAEIEKGINPPVLTVGNLDTSRDFTDVRDMAQAYLLLIEKGIAGEVYNVGSGTSYKISDILKKLLSYSNKEIKVETEGSLVRKTDTKESRCDNKKFVDLTGWTTTIPIDKSLKDTLDYWRNIV